MILTTTMHSQTELIRLDYADLRSLRSPIASLRVTWGRGHHNENLTQIHIPVDLTLQETEIRCIRLLECHAQWLFMPQHVAHCISHHIRHPGPDCMQRAVLSMNITWPTGNPTTPPAVVGLKPHHNQRCLNEGFRADPRQKSEKSSRRGKSSRQRANCNISCQDNASPDASDASQDLILQLSDQLSTVSHPDPLVHLLSSWWPAGNPQPSMHQPKTENAPSPGALIDGMGCCYCTHLSTCKGISQLGCLRPITRPQKSSRRTTLSPLYSNTLLHVIHHLSAVGTALLLL